MTLDAILAAKVIAMTKTEIIHETAANIRKMLDEARTAYGADAFDDDEAEGTILDLVTGDDE